MNCNEYSKEELKEIWKRGNIIDEDVADIVRFDDFGKTIRFKDYENPNSLFGWKADNITSKVKGRLENIDWVRPINLITNPLADINYVFKFEP